MRTMVTKEMCIDLIDDEENNIIDEDDSDEN